MTVEMLDLRTGLVYLQEVTPQRLTPIPAARSQAPTSSIAALALADHHRARQRSLVET